jgi:hypothetical protein
MATEHVPVFPNQKWQCTCGMINDYITYTCIKCGSINSLSTYINPCDSCGLCKDKLKTKFNCDFLVRDNVRY